MNVRAPRQLPAIDVDEIEVQPFEFARALVGAENIESVTVSCEAWSGTDAAAADVLVGAPLISGTQVLQRIRGGVAGVTYSLRCRAVMSSTGRALVAAAHVPCVRL